ncbi:TetR/AcrR family transcriptional regulator [Pseudomonas sp. GZD-222]|uniref:TetR/AcrR family transcriptional regulator n=1 Tax=Pseudomonas sp. GZD-222 TaxID=3404805 RepID=UPI003BB4B814
MIKPDRDNKQAGNGGLVYVQVPAQPRKEPRQARSIALVAALKQTGRQILQQEGREALSVLRLAEEAGVSTSSIYEYFPTIAALIAAIFEDYRRQVRAELLAGIAALPATASLLDGIVLTLRIGLPVLYQKTLFDPLFSVRSTHFDELVRLDLVKAKQLWSTSATSALMSRFASEITIKDREKVEFLAYHMLLALPRAMLLEQPDYLTDERTPVLMARMLHALLATPDH